MENLSVVLVDDHNDDRECLKNYLTKNGLKVLGSFTHGEFMKHAGLEAVPNIAIISFDVPQFQTELNVDFVRKKYPATKVLINSNYVDVKSVDKLIKMRIDGVVFKNRQDTGKTLEALVWLYENKKYFDGIR